MSACLFLYNVAERRPKTIFLSCGSSVVEHSLGKGEVESSILSRSTRLQFNLQSVIFTAETGKTNGKPIAAALSKINMAIGNYAKTGSLSRSPFIVNNHHNS